MPAVIWIAVRPEAGTPTTRATRSTSRRRRVVVLDRSQTFIVALESHAASTSGDGWYLTEDDGGGGHRRLPWQALYQKRRAPEGNCATTFLVVES